MWREMAQKSFEAASFLGANDYARDCISRAYYAAFARVTGALIDAGQKPRPGLGTWSHQTLPELASTALVSGTAASGNLEYALERLYQLRLMADYWPEVEIDDRVGRWAVGLMSQVFGQLASEEGQ
jgi:uncharacterized protein (UPF0332 family)